MNKKIVIIGAGNSGRGFIARLFKADGAEICFLDKDRDLVKKLAKEKCFSVFAGEKQTEYVIDGYQAYAADSDEGLDAAEGADYIIVCVGNQNLTELAPFFERLSERKPADQCKVIVCENGISPKEILRNAVKGTKAEGMLITQGVIFCTSIPKRKGELDIISEEYDELPIDYDEELFRWGSTHFQFIKQFDLLMERKLYTYNCLSACIAYLGYLKNYTDYGAAARDPDIYNFCGRLRGSLDEAVCKLTGVSKKEQEEFSEKAIKKFTSPVIADTIEKNGRVVTRKIGPDERLIGPVKLFLRYRIDTDSLCRVIAAALYYMEKEESLEYGGTIYGNVIALLRAVNPWMESEPGLVRMVENYFSKIKEGEKELWNI